MLGLSTSLVKGGMTGRTYVKDGLKLYMPYKGSDASEVQFVGTGSTSFVTNDYVDTGATFQTTFDGSFSVAFWVKPDDYTTEEQSCFGAKNSGTEDWVHCNIQTDGDVTFYYKANNVTAAEARTSAVAFSSNIWTHICCVADDAADQLKIYINGVSVSVSGGGLGSITMSAFVTVDELLIGARSAAGTAEKFFDGSIKNVAIWSRALTATEIQNVMYKSYVNVSGRLASGLVSWWALDVDYTDYKGSNNGTNSGSTLNTDLYGGDTPVIPRGIDNARTVQADAIGAGSALFDGVDDYIDCGDINDMDGASALTISAWMKRASAGDHVTIVKDLDANNRVGINMFSDGEVYLNMCHGGSDSGGFTSNDTSWHHVAMVFDGSGSGNAGRLKGYLDGIEQSLDFINDIETTTDTNSASFVIGKSPANSTFTDGNICQVGLWSAVLTQAQIQSIMEKTFEELIASEKTNLVSYWALDVDASDSHGDNDGTLT